MIALLVMTDGRRGCIERTIPAALEQLDGPIAYRVIHDDSADPIYHAWLQDAFPAFDVIGTDTRRGFGGAIQAAWSYIEPLPYELLFHLEDDFVITRRIDLNAMRDALHAEPQLAQLALLRNPVNAVERAAGGIIEQHPESYTTIRRGPHGWRAHRRFFTTNPSLYRRELCSRGWPDGPESEGRFGLQLFADDPAAHVAFWGTEGEWCEHIGHERAGTGY